MDLASFRHFSRSYLRPRGPLTLWRFACPDRITTLELQQWFPLAAFLFVLVWYIAAPSAEAAMGLAVLGGLPLLSFLWARAMALGASGQRALRYTAVQVGDELEELVSLDNQSSLPVLWAEFVDRSDLPGYTVTSVRAADGRSSIQWRAHALCSRHGVFTLGPWEMRFGDPFGIFLVRQIYTQPQEILVYPPLAVLPDDFLPHNLARGEHRPLRQPLRAETVTAAYTRAYQPGDPLRHLHWRTTARRDAPFAKIFDPEAASTVWLIPDFDPAVHLGEGDDSTETNMVTLAASLANHLLRKRLAVGLLAHTDKLSVVPPETGPLHLWKALRALAPLRLTCRWPLAQTLSRFHHLISARDLVVVITPSLHADWPGALKRLTGRGGGAEAVLLDPVSFGGESGVEAHRLSLAELGIAVRVVRRGEIRPLPGIYGALRRWEFMALGTGRVVVRQTPRSV